MMGSGLGKKKTTTNFRNFDECHKAGPDTEDCILGRGQYAQYSRKKKKSSHKRKRSSRRKVKRRIKIMKRSASGKQMFKNNRSRRKPQYG